MVRVADTGWGVLFARKAQEAAELALSAISKRDVDQGDAGRKVITCWALAVFLYG